MKQFRMNRQNGVATVLILLLTGLSLTGIVYGTMFYIRGTQEGVKTTHTATQAQIRAWTGVEIARKFFEQFGEARSLNLTRGFVLSVNGISGVRMVVDHVDSATKTIRMNITGCSNASNPVCTGSTGDSNGATSTVQVVYAVSGNAAPSIPNQLSDVMNFKGDVVANGGITFRGDSGNVTIRVDGSFTSSSGLEGINNLYTTANINLSGGGLGSNSMMAANGDINLTASGNYGTVNAMGNILINGHVSAVSIKTNGTTTLNSSGTVASVQSIGDVTVNGWTTYGQIKTKGSIFHNAGTINLLQAERNITQNGWISVTDGTIGGSILSRSGNPSNNIQTVNGYTVDISPLTEITLTDYRVDTNILKSSANYAFEIDNQGNMKVAVRDVNGINNGSYYLVSGIRINNIAYNDYLCTDPNPTNVNQCPKKIGIGFDAVQNSLISYNSATNKWKLNGQMLAPGVAWFDGNLEIASGTYYNTFLATYNISTAGAARPWSINSAGYANVCTNINFPSTYPTNYCNLTDVRLNEDAMGNTALMAGSYETGYTDVAHFRGGDIDLGASNVIFGNVIAGNLLITGGSTTIYGRVATARQSGEGTNTLSGSTTIDLSNESGTGNQIDTGNQNNNNNATPRTKIMWTRYI